MNGSGGFARAGVACTHRCAGGRGRLGHRFPPPKKKPRTSFSHLAHRILTPHSQNAGTSSTQFSHNPHTILTQHSYTHTLAHTFTHTSAHTPARTPARKNSSFAFSQLTDTSLLCGSMAASPGHTEKGMVFGFESIDCTVFGCRWWFS